MNEDREVETLSFSLASYSVLSSVRIDRTFLLENYFTSVTDFNQPLPKNWGKTPQKFSPVKTVSPFQKSDLPTRDIWCKSFVSPQMERRQRVRREKGRHRIYPRFATFSQRISRMEVLAGAKRSNVAWRVNVLESGDGSNANEEKPVERKYRSRVAGHTRRHVLATRGLSYAKGNGRGLPGWRQPAPDRARVDTTTSTSPIRSTLDRRGRGIDRQSSSTLRIRSRASASLRKGGGGIIPKSQKFRLQQQLRQTQPWNRGFVCETFGE